MKELLLATQNQGKIRELKEMLVGENISVLSLNDFSPVLSVDETGGSFEENALLKAIFFARQFQLAALADDSGLVVPALGGEPGIFSARYGNDLALLPNETVDHRNIRKLLLKMASERGHNREAFFKTALAVVKPNGEKLIQSGEWHGVITDKPVGGNGFGYDPVFYDPKMMKTAAEMTKEEKNFCSHRANALNSLKSKLLDFL